MFDGCGCTVSTEIKIAILFLRQHIKTKIVAGSLLITLQKNGAIQLVPEQSSFLELELLTPAQPMLTILNIIPLKKSFRAVHCRLYHLILHRRFLSSSLVLSSIIS